MSTIGIKEALKLKDRIFIDVRSPLEFEEDHILGAINVPILDNDERAIIGTLYKQQGKESAIQKGLDFVVPKLKDLYHRIEGLKREYKEVIVYCFRGGMRSSSVVDFLSSCGLEIRKLEGGYKSYRRFVIDFLSDLDKYRFAVLHGHTGTGKTQMLNALRDCGIAVLDLEEMAKNSGSVFGELYYGGEKPGQKFFETQLFAALLDYESRQRHLIFMESESKKIGRCILSKEFWEKMQEAKHILVEASLPRRVERCVADYVKQGKADDEALIAAILKLKDSLGNKTVEEMIVKVEQKRYYEVAEFLMSNYYDKLYIHSQNKYSYEFTVNSDDMNASVSRIVSWYKENE